MVNIPLAGPWWTEKESDFVRDALLNHPHDYFYVEKFEKEFAEYHGRKHGLMTPNCTQAIHLLLLGLGINEGDEIIVPECTWVGSTAGIDYCRAKPVFCDIEEDNWCLDPKSVRKNITLKTKAILFVDLYGNMPNINELKKISEEYKIPLIEDSAGALGSVLDGKKAGSFGIGSVFSFHRTKTLSTGEGGTLLIDNDELFNRCKFIRDHGRSLTVPYQVDRVSVKYMPSNPQAALAYAQLSRLDELLGKKRQILHWYKNLLDDLNDIQLNQETENIINGAWATTLVFGHSHQMTKNKALESLAKLGIPSRPFFQPLTSQPAYDKKGYSSSEYSRKNPRAYDISSRGITLPSPFELTLEQAETISSGINKIVKH